MYLRLGCDTFLIRLASRAWPLLLMGTAFFVIKVLVRTPVVAVVAVAVVGVVVQE